MSPWPDPTDPNAHPSPWRILVVDDEPTIRLGFAYALRDSATAVETAASGQEAIDRLATDRFDLMILDLRMPELDGISVIRALRDLEISVPTILCSAALHPNAAIQAIRLGVVDFLLKPVRPIDLRHAVHCVTQADTTALSQALAMARHGDWRGAIETLEELSAIDPKSLDWLTILRAIHQPDSAVDDRHTETIVRAKLPQISLNSANFP